MYEEFSISQYIYWDSVIIKCEVTIKPVSNAFKLVIWFLCIHFRLVSNATCTQSQTQLEFNISGVDPVGFDSNSEPDFDPLIFRSDCMIFFLAQGPFVSCN